MQITRTAFLALLFCLTPALLRAQAPAEDEDDGIISVALQTSMLNFDSMGAHLAYGAAVDIGAQNGIDGPLARGRYLFNGNYIKFNTVPLALLVFDSGWIGSGDNDMDSDGDTTLKETCTGPIVRGMLAVALLAFNDGIGYSFPIGKHFGIGPFISPGEMFFYRNPGEKFHLGAFTTFGVTCRAAPGLFGGRAFISAEGEYVRPFLLQSSEAGYRLNFSVGAVF